MCVCSVKLCDAFSCFLCSQQAEQTQGKQNWEDLKSHALINLSVTLVYRKLFSLTIKIPCKKVNSDNFFSYGNEIIHLFSWIENTGRMEDQWICEVLKNDTPY